MSEASQASRDGARYARYAGIVFGIFLIAWSLFGIHPLQTRSGWWDDFARIEPYTHAFFGVWLLFPWKKIGESRHWGKIFGVLCLLCLIFAFVLVTEVMALNYLAKDMSMKARTPVLQGVMLFGALGQIPTLIFYRHPEWLD